MYQLLATVYELEGQLRCYAEFYKGQADDGEPLMTAHVSRTGQLVDGETGHDRILWMIRTVCHEIAENLNEALF